MSTILLIEDATEMAQVIARELNSLGFRVVQAADGVEGLEQFARCQPDLVILDWMLPRLDGLEVLRRLRQASPVPVLMLIGGVMISWIYTEYPFTQPFPWAWTLELIAQTYLSACLILSLHVWISARWSSFIVAAATGIAAEVIGIFAFSSDYVGYFPWTIPGVIATQNLSNLESAAALTLGLGGGIVVALLGCWEVTRRDVL